MDAEVSWMKKTDAQPEDSAPQTVAQETPPEFLASLCSFAVVILFIYTFLGQNFFIPSGSMEETLLVGDHLFVDRITLSPSSKWMPLVRYREPRRNDIIVFHKPVLEDPEGTGDLQSLTLVKRLIGLPGDHIRLRDGIVYINGVAQQQPHAQRTTPENHSKFLDEFPAVPPTIDKGATEAWAVEFPSYIQNGELVVPPGQYFMMGDHRHNSLDSRFWGFVPRQNIIGRPLFNYWSIATPELQPEETGLAATLSRMSYSALHFFSKTRWSRTLHRVM
jgi:signal peptidase I